MAKLFKWFNLDEFESPDEAGSGEKMDLNFVSLLDSMREQAGIEFHINSGYRTAYWNSRVGGKANSAHLRGLAADIRCRNNHERFLIVKAALDHGITRIETSGRTWVHVDADPTLPQEIIF